MWRWWCLVLASCFPSDESTTTPRPREVLIDAFAGGVVIYRDGDEPWQLAPQVCDRFGFDLESERYAVAFVDPERRRVDALYTTLDEHADVRNYAPIPPTGPRHVVSGSLTVVPAFELGWRIAGKHQAVVLRGAPTEFAIPVVEGAQTIIIGELGLIEGELVGVSTVSLIRDVAVARDLELDTEAIANGLPTAVTTTPVLPRNSSCSVLSNFVVGDAAVLLGFFDRGVVTPHPDQWRSGDHLDVHLRCQSDTTFIDSHRLVTTPTLVPKQLDVPPELGDAFLTFPEERFHFGWNTYPRPVDYYETVLGDRTCTESCGARWTSRITEGWVQATTSELDVLSPQDLDALGLWDPTFEPPTPLPWSVSAVWRDTTHHVVAGVDRVGVSP